MKKRGLIVASILIASLALIFLVSFISAANDTNASTTSAVALQGFDKAYSCLTNVVNEKGISTLSPEQLSLSILALGYNATMKTQLLDELNKRKDSNNDCWPSGACTIKDTAQAMLAYDHVGLDTSGIQNWLRNQTMAPTDTDWYLQIDNLNNNLTTCKIIYDNSTKTITIDENKFISGAPGSCFNFGANNYWLQIKPSCYGKSFEVSCNNDFLTSTFYKQQNSQVGPIYLTTSTQTSSPDGKLTEKVESVCLKQGSSCNFEGSLWGALALDKKDSQFKNKILPYLITLAPTNQRYLPSGFLFALTGFTEYFSDLSNLQDKKGFWRVAEASRQYYDTGIALLTLFNQADSVQVQNAEQYLLDPTVQQVEGCWNKDIRDVSLILYAASPRAASPSSGEVSKPECKDQTGYACIPSLECEGMNATVLSASYHCFIGSCCSETPQTTQSCSQKEGIQCSSGQDCEAGLMDIALDTSFCCVGGQCVDKQVTESTCPSPYICKTSCDSATEEPKSAYVCAGSESGVCCAPVVTPQKSYWWVLILAILIILLVLAIIYRNQLKVWWFKTTSGFKKGGATQQTRPPMPPRPGMPMQGMAPRRMLPPGMQRPPMPPARPFPRERELTETLNKIKQISK